MPTELTTHSKQLTFSNNPQTTWQSTLQHPGLLIVLVGPSGVGKSTIALRPGRENAPEIHRQRHDPEKNAKDDLGKKYDFIDEATFFKKLEQGEFLEYANVFDEYYGTPKRPTLDHLANGEDVLLEIDVQGALQVRFQYPDALMIFIMPPDEDHRCCSGCANAIATRKQPSRNGIAARSAKSGWPRAAGRLMTWSSTIRSTGPSTKSAG